jgi:hypothetical protein
MSRFSVRRRAASVAILAAAALGLSACTPEQVARWTTPWDTTFKACNPSVTTWSITDAVEAAGVTSYSWDGATMGLPPHGGDPSLGAELTASRRPYPRVATARNAVLRVSGPDLRATYLALGELYGVTDFRLACWRIAAAR